MTRPVLIHLSRTCPRCSPSTTTDLVVLVVLAPIPFSTPPIGQGYASLEHTKNVHFTAHLMPPAVTN
jgi:hypothetical protein